MAEKSGVPWTESSLGFWTGCKKVSAGCLNCYGERDYHRWGKDYSIIRRTNNATFYKPLKWKEPHRIFVCPHSDFFIAEADEWRPDAWEVMRQTQQHTYMILTKRPERIETCLPNWWNMGFWNAFSDQIDYFRDNIWFGVTLENPDYPDRLYNLIKINNRIRFVSAEPLLGDILANDRINTLLCGIDWIIAGCESGPNARETKIEWFRRLRDFCIKRKISFFLKQMRVGNKLIKMPELDGRVWNEIPKT